MKQLLLVLLFILTGVLNALAQVNNIEENRKSAQRIIFDHFGTKLDTAHYLLYNLDDKYILIEDTKEAYRLFYIRSEVEDSLLINKPHKILKIAFGPRCCETPVDSLKESDPHPHSRYIYFFLKNYGIKHCEFNLPVLFNSSISKKRIYPLNDRVHKFLIKQMFSHWK